MEKNIKNISKHYRISEILRMLYSGKHLSANEVSREFYGADYNKSDLRNIQADFKFLDEESNIPIESYEGKWLIHKDNINSGQKKVGEMEMVASLIQDKYTKIFKNTGFQEVLDNTYRVIQDYHSIKLDDKFQMQDELLDFFYNIETGLFNYSKWEKDIGEIIKAILNRKYIQFQYQSLKSKEPKEHIAFPAKMIYTKGTLYLYIYNFSKATDLDYFMITLHRIIPNTVESHHISEIENDIKEIIKQNPETKNMSIDRFITEKVCDINIDEKRMFSFGLVWKDDNLQNIKLEFKKEAADHVLDRDWHFEPKFKVLENGNLIMEMKLDINRELVTWIMSRLHELKIHEPQELIDMVNKRLKGFQADHKK